MTRRLIHSSLSDRIGEPARAQDVIFRAWIKSTYDALLVFEAARRGMVPRVTRRFHDSEKRSMIVSGAVLVFTEEESGIKRWTDPFVWSASRMLGNFMIYREREDIVEIPASPYSRSVIGTSVSDTKLVEDPELERCIYGSWNRGRGLKTHGLMKKTISLPIEGVVYHLVSYYNPAEVLSGQLQAPSALEPMASLVLSDEMLRNISRLRHPPRMDIDLNGKAIYIGEEENLSSLYSVYTIPSSVLHIPSLPALPIADTLFHSPSQGSVVQSVPHRAVQLPPDSGPIDSGLGRTDASFYSTVSHVQCACGSHDCPHVPHSASANYTPYLRPHEFMHPLYKERRSATLKHAPSRSAIVPSHGHDYASADVPQLRGLEVQGSTLPIPHIYDPSLSRLPALLGGTHPSDRAGFHPEPSTSLQPTTTHVEGLWDAMGGSADWVYFHMSSDAPL